MIEGKNLVLRTIREEDIAELYNLTSNLNERGEFLTLHLISQTDFQKKFKETGFWDEEHGKMLITNKEGKLLGDIVYFKNDRYMPGYEIGYQIYKKEDMGKGITSEALRIFSSYLFDLKPIERLEIVLNVNNIGSRKVAEKCGYIFEGVKRKGIFSRGVYQDVQLFSLLREECPSLKDVLNDK
ncbi:GNAT family N-acetyltransferase [Chengkuizengella axinellae]|uniref:GNAT family protein n=1 Tax=Chengkuizengella axinellae TaxID=3064388 RepID=A0ABT9IYH6_9BACL|nr:GNAT family protein [Chengkuizengella sp. 2205SS18-9]MDP5274202.1 GNAT family protein [Chengkuizengella sp. 2205SS18-9]